MKVAKTVMMANRPVIELLAPAGDREKLETAVRYGADAVYLGTDAFSLRSASANFKTGHELNDAVAWAHKQGVKVYVAFNSLVRDHDLIRAEKELEAIASSDADALILSDPGLFSLAGDVCPGMVRHISTQASVTNSRTANLWYELGARRIILARELSLRDIADIRRNVPADLELEGFVHGAMCVAWSGRCLLSAYFNGADRSANRGSCTQPCRWAYRAELTVANHPDKPLILEEDNRGAYVLSSSDLCMIEHLPALVRAGLTSFKIEGRTKSSFYVAMTVRIYRQAIDRLLADPDCAESDPTWLEELNKTSHRHFSTGFYFAETSESLTGEAAAIHTDNMTYQGALVIGVVREILANGRSVIEQKNKIACGESVDIVPPHGDVIAWTVTDLRDLEGQPLTATPHPGMLYTASLPLCPVGTFIRKTI